MKNKFLYIFIFTIFLFPSLFYTQEKKDTPIIRKDLLNLKNNKFSVIMKRNIFSWNVNKSKNAKHNSMKGKIRQTIETKKKDDSSYIDIKYIGYILSKKKILGVILFRGEEKIVEEGEILENGLKVNEIKKKEIEIQINSKKIRIPLEEIDVIMTKNFEENVRF